MSMEVGQCCLLVSRLHNLLRQDCAVPRQCCVESTIRQKSVLELEVEMLKWAHGTEGQVSTEIFVLMKQAVQAVLLKHLDQRYEVCIIIEFSAMTMLTPWCVEPINHGTGPQMPLASLQAVMAEVGRAKNRYDKRSSFTVKIRTKE